MADEILRELWQIKDDLAREFRCDLDAYVAHLRRSESRPGRTLVDRRSAEKAAEQVVTQDATVPHTG